MEQPQKLNVTEIENGLIASIEVEGNVYAIRTIYLGVNEVHTTLLLDNQELTTIKDSSSMYIRDKKRDVFLAKQLMTRFGRKTYPKYLKHIHILIDIINENRDILDEINKKLIIEKFEKEEAEKAKRELELFKYLDSYYNDYRSKAAQYIYFIQKSGVIKVIKVPRAGATTCLGIESYLKHEIGLIATVQNDIIDDTIIKGIDDTCKLYGIKPPNIVSVPSNLKCIHYLNRINALENEIIRCEKEYERLKQMAESGGAVTEYEELKAKEELACAKGTYNRFTHLKVVLRDEICGDECEYFAECPCTKVLHEPNIDLIVTTYGKLINIVRVVKNSRKNSFGVNKQILQIFKECKNIILDESHELDGEPFNIKLDIENSIFRRKIKSGGFKQLYNNEKYTDIARLLDLIYDFHKSKEIKKAIKKSRTIAKLEDYTQHNRIEVTRPLKQEQNPKTKKLQDITVFTTTRSTIDELITSGDAHRLKISNEEIDILLGYTNLLNEKDYVVTTDRVENELITKIATSVNLTHLYLKEFLEAIQGTEDSEDLEETEDSEEIQEKKDYRIFFNSATHGDFDYSKLVKEGTEIFDIPFGNNGDPLKIVERMNIFSFNLNLCTNSDLSNSIQQHMPRILELLIWGLEEYGTEGCFFCTINKKSARLIERALKNAGYDKEIFVFRGKGTIGTACAARFGVLISAGYIPSNAKYYIKDKKEKELKALIDAFNATIQAMFRIADPDGKFNSALVAIMKQEDLLALLKQATHNSIMKSPEVFPWYSNNKIGFAKIRTHINRTNNQENNANFTPKTLYSEDENEQSKNPSVDLPKNPAEEISENFDSVSQQSDSGNNKVPSNNKYFNISGLKALNILYANIIMKVCFFDRLEAREFSQDFSQNHTLKLCESNIFAVNESEHSENENPKRGSPSDFSEDLEGGFSDSDWKWHKIGKNPLVTDLISVKNEICVFGFTGLEKSHAKHIEEAINGEFTPLIFKETKDSTYSILILTVPIPAGTAKEICKNILAKVFTNHGVKLKPEMIPRYSSHQSAKTNSKDNNKFRLPMYSGEQVLRDGKFTADFEDMQVTIHHLRHYEKIHAKEDEFLANAFYPEKCLKESEQIK